MIHNDDNDDDANDNSSQDCWEREGRRATKDAGWKTMIFSRYFRKLWYFQDIDAMMIFNPLIFSRYWWWYLIPWYLLEPDDDIQDMPFDNLRKTMILIYNDLKWGPPIYDQENDFDLTKGWDEEARTRTVGEDQGKLLLIMISCHDRHIDQLSWSSQWSTVMIITFINSDL